MRRAPSLKRPLIAYPLAFHLLTLLFSFAALLAIAVFFLVLVGPMGMSPSSRTVIDGLVGQTLEVCNEALERSGLAGASAARRGHAEADCDDRGSARKGRHPRALAD
mgnify:CR=1 FL=1